MLSYPKIINHASAGEGNSKAFYGQVNKGESDPTRDFQ
jgi:hypothetical protein